MYVSYVYVFANVNVNELYVNVVPGVLLSTT